MPREGDESRSLDQRALAKTQEAFRLSPDDKMLAEFIENPDLKAIVKAGASLSDEDLDKLRKVMESLYPNWSLRRLSLWWAVSMQMRCRQQRK